VSVVWWSRRLNHVPDCAVGFGDGHTYGRDQCLLSSHLSRRLDDSFIGRELAALAQSYICRRHCSAACCLAAANIMTSPPSSNGGGGGGKQHRHAAAGPM